MTEPVARRPPFNEELQKMAEGFTQQMIDTIPELEAIAVVFSYGVPNPNLPYAVVRGQNGALRSPAEIVHMTQQLWQTLGFQLQNGMECIRLLDEYMKQKADELKQLQDQLNAVKQEVAACRTGSGDQDIPGKS